VCEASTLSAERFCKIEEFQARYTRKNYDRDIYLYREEWKYHENVVYKGMQDILDLDSEGLFRWSGPGPIGASWPYG
jgi:hypothetical protein